MGKNALVLSGGAARGAYEIGVWKALRDEHIQFDIIVGASIGAMNAYILSQGKTHDAEELWLTLKTGEIFDFEHVIENKGVRFTGIKDVLNERFSEKSVRESEVDFGVVAVKLPEMSPVYMWKEDMPEGQMLDWVLASCSCFPVVAAYEIDGEKYIDGGFHDVMPISMALERGADKIYAVYISAVGKKQKDDIKKAGDKLVMINPSRELGNPIKFTAEKAMELMEMGRLDTLKTLGKYDGKLFTFEKGSFAADEIKMAEKAGEIFDLPPYIIYTRESFLTTLKDAVAICRAYKDSEASKALLKRVDADEINSVGKQTAFLAVCDKLKNTDSSALWMVMNGLV